MTDRIRINPFADDIVKDPRVIEPGVPGLNERPLKRLLREFALLEEGDVPRSEQRVSHAQLILSSQPGYGKSHLLGRLFEQLAGRATLVNVRPFRVRDGDWRALLNHTVDELSMVDRFTRQEADNPTQWTAFAHGVLSHLGAIWIRSNPQYAKRPFLEVFHQNPLETWRVAQRYSGWGKVVGELITNRMPELLETLHRHQPSFHTRPEVWLRLFHTVGFLSPKAQSLASVRDWLKGEAIAPEDAVLIGLDPRDAPPMELSLRDRNALAKERLLDLCRWSGFFRPFLFCFDQTETYGDDKKLARSLGQLVQEMQQELPNQLTVMTANQMPWSQRIRPHWEQAAQDRLGAALNLDGIDYKQGEALIASRLERCRAQKRQSRFLSGGWLQQFFVPYTKGAGVRLFLKECHKQWEEVFNPDDPLSTDGMTIQERYAALVRPLEESPSKLGFDDQRLLWCVELVLQGDGGDLKRDGMTLLLRGGDRKSPLLRIHLDNSNHWKHWQSLAQWASQQQAKGRSCCLRTPELSPIPAPGWLVAKEAILAAQAQGALRVVVLSLRELAGLYAAFDLYADACAGDLPFSVQETRSFLLQALEPFRNRLLEVGSGGTAPVPWAEPEPPDQTLVKRLHTLMSRNKLLTETEVLGQLQPCPSLEMLHRAREQIPQIHLQHGPNWTVWLWVPRKS